MKTLASIVSWGLLAFLTLAPGPTLADQVSIPGTTVSMEAPAGFTVSKGLTGLENTATGSTIVVAEFPDAAYAQMAPPFADLATANRSFAKNNIAMDSRKVLIVEGNSVPFLAGTQSTGAGKVGKYAALFHGDMTVLVTFSARDPGNLAQQMAEQAMASVKLSPGLTLQQKIELLPFSFKAVAPFRSVSVNLGVSAGLTTFDVADPTGRKPYAIISAPPGAMPDTMTLTQIAEALVRTVKGFEKAEISRTREVTFAGGPASYLEAVSGNRRLVQYLRRDASGALTHMAAIGEKAELDKVMEAVSQIASSVSGRQ